jgi:hypothetical protein
MPTKTNHTRPSQSKQTTQDQVNQVKLNELIWEEINI